MISQIQTWGVHMHTWHTKTENLYLRTMVLQMFSQNLTLLDLK